MANIALIHLLWLLLLPIGVTVLVKAALSSVRRRVEIGIALMLLVLSLPAVLFCLMMSPLDFLGLGRQVRVGVGGPRYTVVIVQEPGDDFYEGYLEICRSDGKVTRLMVDYDGDKWWGLRANSKGTRTDFVTLSGRVVSSVDFADGTVSGASDRKVYKLDELDFGRKWSNGG